jgi:hypothetical protein
VSETSEPLELGEPDAVPSWVADAKLGVALRAMLQNARVDRAVRLYVYGGGRFVCQYEGGDLFGDVENDESRALAALLRPSPPKGPTE